MLYDMGDFNLNASLVVVIESVDPRPNGDVSDGIHAAYHPMLAMITQLTFQHCQQTIHLLSIAFNAIYIVNIIVLE